MLTKQPVPQEGDKFDYNIAKRKVTWSIKNFRGGQTRQLEMSLTYDQKAQINEVAFKQLGPFNIDFDIPNHTSSGIKISKMDVKLINP